MAVPHRRAEAFNEAKCLTKAGTVLCYALLQTVPKTLPALTTQTFRSMHPSVFSGQDNFVFDSSLLLVDTGLYCGCVSQQAGGKEGAASFAANLVWIGK